jgi:hypothetical protein
MVSGLAAGGHGRRPSRGSRNAASGHSQGRQPLVSTAARIGAPKGRKNSIPHVSPVPFDPMLPFQDPGRVVGGGSDGSEEGFVVRHGLLTFAVPSS